MKLIGLLLLLLVVAAVSGEVIESWRRCRFEPRSQLNDTQALYLQANSTSFFHPATRDALLLAGELPQLRIACANGNVAVRGNLTGWTSVLVECLGGQAVRVSGSWIIGPLSDIGCVERGEPVGRLTGRTAPNGKRLAELGFELGPLEFASVVDQLTVSKRQGGHVTRWLHFQLANALASRQQLQATEQLEMRNGELSGDIAYGEVYDGEEQRRIFAERFADEQLVEQYLPVDGSHAFVPGALVSQEDLYYAAEQEVTSLYETTTPVWRSVAEGNWHLVGEAVRQLAQRSLAHLEVWSGSYLSLYLPGANNRTTYVELPQQIRPAQFLFRYVLDRSNQRGLVFVTLNNPHLEQPTHKDLICEPLERCERDFPQFADLDKGFTYCCSLQSFAEHAVKLGLPTFGEEVQSF